MLITITKSDIASGGHNYNDCPVAIAIRRKLMKTAFVGPINCYIFYDNFHIDFDYRNAVKIELPPKVKDFINRYDKQLPVIPIRFELDIKETDDN